MADNKTVAITEALWVRLKQRALDERVTLREVVERACHQYVGGLVAAKPEPTASTTGDYRWSSDDTSKRPEKHWTPDE